MLTVPSICDLRAELPMDSILRFTEGRRMPSDSSQAFDSLIWMNAASTGDPFSHLEPPENLDELTEKAREASKDELEKRTQRFRSRASQETLSKPVK